MVDWNKETIKKVVDIIEPRIRARNPKSFEEEFEFMVDELIELDLEELEDDALG